MLKLVETCRNVLKHVETYLNWIFQILQFEISSISKYILPFSIIVSKPSNFSCRHSSIVLVFLLRILLKKRMKTELFFQEFTLHCSITTIIVNKILTRKPASSDYFSFSMALTDIIYVEVTFRHVIPDLSVEILDAKNSLHGISIFSPEIVHYATVIFYSTDKTRL